MADFRTELRSQRARREAVADLVARMKVTGRGTPGRFMEAGRNFNDELNLGVGFWTAVADILKRLGPTPDLLEAERQICTLCRSYQRNGPLVVKVRRAHGRAIKQTDFVNLLMRGGMPRTKAEKLAVKLSTANAARTRRLLHFQELGSYLMWSTFCDDCDCADPFAPPSAPGPLIDSLGLLFEPGQLFLLLAYELPAGTERHTPTIADAYGSTFFFPFRLGGRTHPVRDMDLSGRPEVVHQPITGRFLTGPIRSVIPDPLLRAVP